MWSAPVGSLVFLASFTSILGSKGVIFDVTTVYDVSNVCRGPALSTNGSDELRSQSAIEKPCDSIVKGRVHVRTNAYGLPVSRIPESTSPLLPNLNSNSLLESKWKIDGWRSKPSEEYINVEEQLVYSFHGKIKLKISNKSNWPTEVFVFFTTGSSNLRDEESLYFMHVTRSTHSQHELLVPFYTQCNSSKVGENHGYTDYNFEVKDRDGSTVAVRCYWSGILFAINTIGTTYIYDDNEIYVMRPETSDYQLLSNINSRKYISVHRSGSLGDYDVKINIPVLSTKAQNSELTSPLINTDRICLVLVVYYGKDIQSDQLQILTEDLSGVRRPIYTVHDAEAGWSVIRINESLQTYQPIKIIIKTLDSTEVEIRLINICDANDEKVGILSSISHNSSLPLSSLPINNVYPDLWMSEPYEELSNDCKNGGVKTSGGCACPPGFIGTLCESGCGLNRFGQDCGGVCSFRTKGCRGVALCSPFIKCACAPGYMGDNCNKQCSPGTYGNNCLQQCGHCLSNKPCDIYTGSCDDCEVGYLTPQCSEAYVYYSLKPALSSDDYGTIKVSFNPKNGTLGYGTPKIYQIQYKEVGGEWSTYVSKMVPTKYHREATFVEDEVEEVIENLKDSVMYEVRVIFMDANFNKYDGELVQVSKMLTKCDIPEDYDYNIQSATNTTSLTFSWTYNNMTDHWCSVESYEVSWEEDWLWLTAHTQDTTYTLTDFIPDSAVNFKVRAKTSGGFAPFSKIVTATTSYNGSSTVRDLRVTTSRSSSVTLSWQPPIGNEHRKLRYIISYKCVNQLACSPGCKDAMEGQLTQEDTKITLSPLLPFTQYLVTVTPDDGLPSKIYVGTSEAVPTETPGLSEQGPIRTNTSLTVFWTPATVCSSHLTGYSYQLIKESDSLTIVDNGFTRGTSASFKNLTASTNYIAKIYVVTIAGWNTVAHLSINTSTSATVPEAVRNLTVYKSGRNMLGLRWAAPKATYGTLKSFQVGHSLGKDTTSHSIEAKPCVVWPTLFCYTINNLRPNRMYNITVSARNVDVAEDGAKAFVNGLTREISPSSPENLSLVNSTSTTVGLRWNHPNLANGIIRSFVVSVEETEKFDQDSCCQVYPLVEIPVTEEKDAYDVEVSGLHPASTYVVSVSAKTVGLGPSQSKTVVTRPPHLAITVTPNLPDYDDLHLELEDDMWLPQENLPELNNSEIYSSLIEAHLLLIVPSDLQAPINESCIKEPKLDSLLRNEIGDQFWFYKEYNEESYIDNSNWGYPVDCVSLQDGQKYRVVAVQVSAFSGAYNVDLCYYTSGI